MTSLQAIQHERLHNALFGLGAKVPTDGSGFFLVDGGAGGGVTAPTGGPVTSPPYSAPCEYAEPACGAGQSAQFVPPPAGVKCGSYVCGPVQAPTPTTCAPGYQIDSNGNCVPISTIGPTSGGCPTGETMVDNVCVPSNANPVTCPVNYTFFNGSCIPISCPQIPYPGCPNGTTTVPYAGPNPCGGPPTCSPIGGVCPPGWQFDVFGNCANENSIPNTPFNPCPAGFQLNAASQCMPATAGYGTSPYISTSPFGAAPVSPSWLGQNTIFGSVPNYIAVGGLALGAILLVKVLGKK